MANFGSFRIDNVDIVKNPLEINEKTGVVPQKNNLDKEAYGSGEHAELQDAPSHFGEALKMAGLWDR